MPTWEARGKRSATWAEVRSVSVLSPVGHDLTLRQKDQCYGTELLQAGSFAVCISEFLPSSCHYFLSLSPCWPRPLSLVSWLESSGPSWPSTPTSGQRLWLLSITQKSLPLSLVYCGPTALWDERTVNPFMSPHKQTHTISFKVRVSCTLWDRKKSCSFAFNGQWLAIFNNLNPRVCYLHFSIHKAQMVDYLPEQERSSLHSPLPVTFFIHFYTYRMNLQTTQII